MRLLTFETVDQFLLHLGVHNAFEEYSNTKHFYFLTISSVYMEKTQIYVVGMALVPLSMTFWNGVYYRFWQNV
jgi:hypothetical protein